MGNIEEKIFVEVSKVVERIVVVGEEKDGPLSPEDKKKARDCKDKILPQIRKKIKKEACPSSPPRQPKRDIPLEAFTELVQGGALGKETKELEEMLEEF